MRTNMLKFWSQKTLRDYAFTLSLPAICGYLCGGTFKGCSLAVL